MKILNKIIPLSIALFSLAACNDAMDYRENSIYEKEIIFSSFANTRSMVTNIYGILDNGLSEYGSGAMLASASDEAVFAWSTSNIHDFYNGAWSAENTLSSTWGDSYWGIRACNLFLAEAPNRTFEENKYNTDYTQQMARFNRYQYEVRFLRAYFYFNLVKTYGDVPLVKEMLTEEQANMVTKTPSAEIFKFIADECSEIVNELPVNYDVTTIIDAETGRVTKQAVLALKARALMYAASPLFNKNNDASLWTAAALANKAVIDTCAKYNIRLGAYTTLWGNDGYKANEMIFGRRTGSNRTFESTNFPVGVEGGNSGNCPSQTLVDAYGMKTGTFDPANPYANRDPRLAMTVVVNGITGWPAYNTGAIETFEGGKNGLPLAGATPTGYYLRKYADPTVDLRPEKLNAKFHTWIVFRLGEFYLNYAECVFNMSGSADVAPTGFTLTPLAAVNAVRTRAGVGMPALASGLSSDEFIEKYRNERMVELAFEGHRFWDVRRWKIGNVLSSVKVLKLTKNAETNQLTYEYKTINRRWEDKMYFFPIPAVEIRKNQNLAPNNGW